MFIDENGLTCFVDQNGLTCWVDQNGIELCCGTDSGVATRGRVFSSSSEYFSPYVINLG